MKHTFFYSLFIIFNLSTVLSQPLETSEEEYRSIFAKRLMRSFDQNHDGYYEKDENPHFFDRYKKLDKNNDEKISLQELQRTGLPYLQHEGKSMLNVIYKETEEEKLCLDIYYPSTYTKGKKLPVVFYTHGGGWSVGHKHRIAGGSFGKIAKSLLDKGFCVVSVNYRLYVVNGTVSMRDCVIDSKDAMRFIAKHSQALGIDSQRFYSFGDSAGGQIAQLLLLSKPNSLVGDPTLSKYNYKMVAGVSWYGPCDFENTQLFNYDDRPNFRNRFEGRILKPTSDPKDKQSLFKEMSAINYLAQDSPPLLMIQGDKDRTIPVKHAYYMQEKVKEKGINTVEIVVVKNSMHNWGADDKTKAITPSLDEIEKMTIDFISKQE